MTDQPKPSLNDLLRRFAAPANRITFRGAETRAEANRALRRAAGKDVPEPETPRPFPWKSLGDAADEGDPDAA